MSSIKITLPDNSHKEIPKGSTCLAAAEAIGPRLARDALAAKVDGKLVDLSHKLEADCKIELLTFDSHDGKHVFWHSANHILANAVSELYPGIALGIGPAIEEGFYYDFFKQTPFTPDDLAAIEKKMHEIVKADLRIDRLEMTKKKAVEFLSKNKELNRFRLEIVQGIPSDTVSFYQQGSFIDLCEGPHVPSTGRVKAFKLLKVAAAFWKGDAKNPQLQRVYGIAFPAQKQLDEHNHLLEEAAKRDHRKIASELDLFSVSDLAGAGLLMFHPNGGLIRMSLEDFVRQEHLKRGYVPVYTPHLIKSDVWKTSGHYDNYKENMYFTEIEGAEYGVKPMNCPGHILIYKARSHSYKELPLRFFELGTVYRNELSGVLSGLFRVRGFTQDDSHIFLAPHMVKDEVKRVMEFALFVLRTFGFQEFVINVSTKPQKAIGSDEQWQHATLALKQSLDDMGLKYEIDEGGGAFYGPKIDVKIKDALGRLWQCTTVQIDFNQPERFDVTFVGADGKKQRAVIIHRALLGSIERFLGVLLEHYSGALPLWLSPVQVILLPVSETHNGFAQSLATRMAGAGIRVEVDDSSEKTGSKIRGAQMRKIPLMLVVGEKEKATNTLAVRTRNGDIEEGVGVDAFVERTKKQIEERT